MTYNRHHAPASAGGWRRRCATMMAVGMLASVAAPALGVSPASASPGDISTVAGTGSPVSSGDGGPAASAGLNAPYGVTVGAGNTYISEGLGNLVRQVRADGTISTLAGGGTVPLGDGGPAIAAALDAPNGVAVDSHGNLFIGDSGNNRVRRVDPAGNIATVAGGGSATANGVKATSAKLDQPTAVALDDHGNLFIAEEGTNRVRRVDTAGVITTVAGNGTDTFNGDGIPATAAGFALRGIAVDRARNLFIADVTGRIRKVDATTHTITTVAGTGGSDSTGDNGPAVLAQIGFPEDVSVDVAGNLYISSVIANVIRKVNTAGIITTVAGGGTPADGLGDGGAPTAAAFDFPQGAVSDTAGRVTIADTNHNRIRRVSAGVINTIAGTGSIVFGSGGFSGDGGPAIHAQLNLPRRLAVDAGGAVYFADAANNRIRRIDTQGNIGTVAGGGVADGVPATSSALSGPEGLAVDGAGNVFIADCHDARVRRVEHATGTISTVAGGGQPPGGLGDGLAATSAALVCPSGLFVVTAGTDPPAGTLYIADCGDNRVRRVDPSGKITTVAGTGAAGFNGDSKPAAGTMLNCPSDVRLDRANNLLIADSANNRVRRVDARTSRVTTAAGDGATGFGADGRATAAHVNYPTGLATDGAGNLFIAENRHGRVRKVDSAGTITTVAGTGVPGFSGDGGPATLATLDNPTQVALDSAGALLITDGAAPIDLTHGNNRVRRVEAGAFMPPPTGCGALIAHSIKLTADIGPCPGDGLVAGADNITLDLGGHKVFGTGNGDGSRPGIRLYQRHGVTIRNGTVSGFASGVAMFGGSRNTVTGVTITANVGPPASETPEFGDGIAMLFSSANRIVANTITGNGNFDGIFIGGLGSNTNTIDGNLIEGNIGPGLLINPFVDVNLPGRGGSVHGNSVFRNTIRHNEDAGVSNISNRDARISLNTVEGNGSLTGLLKGGSSNGIGVQAGAIADQTTNDVVDHNAVRGNYIDGIQILTMGNRIIANTSTGNGLAGFGFDLDDVTVPDCAHNTWVANIWGAAGFNPPCTSTAGHMAPGLVARPNIVTSPRAGTGAPARTPGRLLGAPDGALAGVILARLPQ